MLARTVRYDTYQVPCRAPMQHLHLVHCQSQALSLAAAGFQLSSQEFLHLSGILLKFLIKCLIGLCSIQESPSKEVLDLFPLNLCLWRAPKPFPQVLGRVRYIFVAASEQLLAHVPGRRYRMPRRLLKVISVR